MVESTLNACGAESFVIVLMKYEGNAPHIIPAALYIVPGRIRSEIIASLKERKRNEDELEEGREDDETPIEEHFFTAFMHGTVPLSRETGFSPWEEGRDTKVVLRDSRYGL